jgi:penicillin amidase
MMSSVVTRVRTTLLAFCLCIAGGQASDIEILRDRWGVPHIYARSIDDVFYAQGYFAAKDRLFQLDLWRRQGTGKLAEILGPEAIPRDRLARLVRFRGDWDAEWKSYAPDAKRIVEQFVAGINHYIKSLKGQRPIEFQLAGYDPQPWAAEDVVSRIAGLLMTRNVRSEVERAQDICRFGLQAVQLYLPPDPFVQLAIPKGVDLALITRGILRDYEAAIATPQLALQASETTGDGEQGSNNWVVDGTMTHTGKPLLANDPHRPVMLPSLRKTWHLVAPGLNVFGAGEPALPGIAVGHNEWIAWGFTIVGIDQQDLYVEKLNPQNPDEYRYRGAWRPVEREQQDIKVKGRAQPERVELRYTIHGPIIHEDREHHLAYALKWVGAEPGGAGYLPALSLMRAKNWSEFLKAVERYKVPSENLVYADTDGNIGWIAAGAAPVRKGWTGLLPVPGDSGEYEWQGYLPLSEHPQLYNPQRHFIATANHNILPPGYAHQLGFEWALPYRFERIEAMLTGRSGLDRMDFERMQQDILCLPARRFQALLRQWRPPEGSREAEIVREMIRWDGQMRVDSEPALIYEVWISKLGPALFGDGLGARVNLETVLRKLESGLDTKALQSSLDAALAQIEKALPAGERQWGRIHQIFFRHPLGVKPWSFGPFARPGDANTINATSGANFRQSSGASYREIIDLSDWDRSEMTNAPGESGDPRSRYYDDLLEEWKYGVYHPMAYSRKFVEHNTEERYILHRDDQPASQ